MGKAERDVLIKELLEFIFKLHEKKGGFDKENDKVNEETKEKMFEYYNKSGVLENVNLLLIKGFNSSLGADFSNKKYENKVKKENTLPLYIQTYSLGRVSYLNSLTFSLRSKKNNRPIYLDFKKINSGWAGSMKKASTSYFNANVPWKAKVSSLSKLIMSVVFLGKDDELVSQEKLLYQIYSSYKMRYFRITIKDFYGLKETCTNLLKLFSNEHLNELLHNKEFSKQLTQLLLKKGEKMRNFNLFVDGIDELKQIEKFFKKKGIKIEVDPVYSLYGNNFDEYLKNYVFFEETMLNLIKKRKFGLTDLYENNKFDYDDIFYSEILKLGIINDIKIGKKMYKRIADGSDINYHEYMLNSFLTQPDLSNSLELTQDVYQSYLRDIGIGFDDKYFTKIDCEILRYKKEEKNDTLLKNINLFLIKKI